MNYANITSLMKVKNKPKQTQLKPKQSQFKPNCFKGQKLMQSVYLQRIMKINVDMGQKKQSQFKPNLSSVSLRPVFFIPSSVVFSLESAVCFLQSVLCAPTTNFEKKNTLAGSRFMAHTKSNRGFIPILSRDRKRTVIAFNFIYKGGFDYVK